MLLVFVALDNQRRLQLRRNLHIIISIDAQDIFYYVARTLNVNTIGRNFQLQSLSVLAEDFHLQRVANALDGLYGNVLAHQRVNIAIVEIDNGILHLLRINVLDFHRHLTASQLLAQLCGVL